MAVDDIETAYLDCADAIDALVRPLPADALQAPVAACPGWTVRDVIAHVVGVVDWALAGRLRGVPTDADTAAQVAELADVEVAELLDRWRDTAPGFASFASSAGIWPAAIDVCTHEHDIRQAIAQPDRRDGTTVRLLADVLVDGWMPTSPVDVELPHRRVHRGPTGDGPTLRTDSFELLRARLGRRSPGQLADLGWVGDPGTLPAELPIFGPTPTDLAE